jgi:two-component system cell cycle sensor histidine kinase/response regulator CckA
VRAKEVEASGVVYPPDAEHPRLFLRIAQMKDIRVVRETPGIDYKIAAIIAAVVLALTTGSIVLLRLRNSRRERALQRLAARLESTQRAVDEGLLVLDAKGNFVESNPLLGKLLDLPTDDMNRASGSLNAVGNLLNSRFTDDNFLHFWQQANKSGRGDDARLIEQHEFQTCGPVARAILIKTTPVFDTYGGIDARVWTFSDVSKRKELEANQMHAQKMQAVSQVVGGVAHDFNNMLMTISANLEMIEPQSGASDAQVVACIADIHSACSLAADLAKNLMAFSQHSELTRKHWDVNDVVSQMCKLFASSLDARVTLHTSFAPGLRSCSLDRNYLIQALLNICLNARDALADTCGNIYVSTSTTSYEDLTRSPVLFNPQVDPTDFIRIRIQDDGEGVPEELTEKIFEPFFTTKPEGKGTGIGLATSRKLIRQHGGDIQCLSTHHQGACFDVYLPMPPQSSDSANLKKYGVSLSREH